MKPRLKSTRAARELIKAHEPFHGEAVRRGKRWVVGYGHTAAAKAGVTLSREDADLLLIYDVVQAETAVHAVLGEDIADPVRDALVSFAASVGLNAFKVSDVARLAKAGKLEAAAAALETWVRAEEDGRLVTSERLVVRRAAEKAVLLGAARPAAVEPEEPQPEPAPDKPARTSGPLVDVDIAFEDLDDDAPAAETAPEPEAEVEAEPASEDITKPIEAVTPEPAAAEPDSSAAPEPEPELEAPAEPADPAEDVKASQDAAIKTVMSRMAGEIARSVSAPGPLDAAEPDGDTSDPDSKPDPAAAEADAPAEPARDLAGVPLGYFFLNPAHVRWTPADDAQAEPAVEPEAAEEAAVEAHSGEVAGPGRAVGSPAPGPVYATVSVGPIDRSETAPPHPGEAPAAAPGLSGESVGPDHPEDGDHEEAGEDEVELEPAIVAGPEALYAGDEAPPGAVESRGQWVHGLSLVAGTVFAGFGGWFIVSEFDQLMATGLMANWPGPLVFALGVLMLVSSGWVVIGDLMSKKKDG